MTYLSSRKIDLTQGSFVRGMPGQGLKLQYTIRQGKLLLCAHLKGAMGLTVRR